MCYALTLSVRGEAPDWAVLTNIASHYNLPLPPNGAALVLAHTESWTMLGQSSTSRDPGIYSPAFLLEEKTNGLVILRGTEFQTLKKRPNEPLWRNFSTAQVKPKPGGYAVSFDRLSVFICAVQLAMLGQQSTAQEVWQRFSSSKWWSDGQSFDRTAEQVKDPPLLLGRCLFDHLRNQILTQPTNWTKIHAELGFLFAEFPTLLNPQRREIFDGLTAAIEAKTPTPDSIEALLLDWSRQPGKSSYFGTLNLFEEGDDTNVAARKIVLRGAAAVPDLLALLNDRRITVHEADTFMNVSTRIQTLGDLARLLLEEITNVRPASPWEKPDSALFEAWLEKCRDKGETEGLVNSVFTREKGKIIGINETQARLIAQKFPEHLAALCDEFAKDATAETQPFSLAEAVASAQLPKEVRVKTLCDFAKRGSLEHKRCILQTLGSVLIWTGGGIIGLGLLDGNYWWPI